MKTFESVAQMKLARLGAGQLIETKSYYGSSPTDTAGAARYKVVTAAEYGGTPDEFGDHTLANGNVAVLVRVLGIWNPLQYGVTNDNVDSTAAHDAFIAAVKANGGGQVDYPYGQYKFREMTIDFDNANFDFNNSTLNNRDPGGTTSLGAFVNVMGPRAGVGPWSTTEVISNIAFRNVDIQWDDNGLATAQNGLAIFNCRDAVFDNISVDITGAQKCVFVGIQEQDTIIDNIVLRGIRCRNALYGFWYFLGGGAWKADTGKVFKNVSLNTFQTFNCDYGFAFAGSVEPDTTRLEQIDVTNGTITAAPTAGIFHNGFSSTDSNWDVEPTFSNIEITGTSQCHIDYRGLRGVFRDIVIDGQVDQTGFQDACVYFNQAVAGFGTTKALLDNISFKNVRPVDGTTTISLIRIAPTDDSEITITNCDFTFDEPGLGSFSQFDVNYVVGSTGITGLVRLGKNKHVQRTRNINNSNSTGTLEYIISDLGGNIGATLFANTTYERGANDPVTLGITAYYPNGSRFTNSNANTGQPAGWVLTSSGWKPEANLA